MTKYKGRDIFVWVGNDVATAAPIVCSTSCDIEITAEMKEVASVTDGRAKDFVSGRYTWAVNSDSLVAVDEAMQKEDLVERLKKGQKVFVAWGAGSPDGGPFRGYSGNAWVQRVGEGAPLAGMATLSVALQGTGPLSVEKVE